MVSLCGLQGIFYNSTCFTILHQIPSNYTPTQTYVSAHIDIRPDPTPIFHFAKSAKLIPFRFVIISHISPHFTKSNFLQLLVIPAYIGLGVCTPLGAFEDVGVGALGVCPTTLTHAYASAHKLPQLDPALGFQIKNCVSDKPFAKATAPH
jgi:hypothetical protein